MAVSFADLTRAIGARAKRRRLIARAWLKRRELSPVADRTGDIRPGEILLFATMRNEAARLPYFLTHYRRMGVARFLIVLNASDDGSDSLLAAQPDVSLWRAGASYRAARFGMDWINHLLARYGRGHWCLTVDADELLVIPHGDSRDLGDLTRWLDARGAAAMSALMLDLYPKGPLSGARVAPGQSPVEAMPWFDAWGYDWEWLPRFEAISIRGGPRRRAFFQNDPGAAPHLHKTPLIRWSWRDAYVSSTHIALPRRLNHGFDPREGLPTGVLLHDKFRDQAIGRARDEKLRREHFTHAERYDRYYDAIMADPTLWTPESRRFRDWRDLVAAGLMTQGDWR